MKLSLFAQFDTILDRDHSMDDKLNLVKKTLKDILPDIELRVFITNIQNVEKKFLIKPSDIVLKDKKEEK